MKTKFYLAYTWVFKMAAKCLDPCTSSVTALQMENYNLNYKMMKPLDEVLRCRICFDYFNNCMMTKCSHNYCSVCIRRYMMYKSQCPTCFKDAFEPELRNNRVIDEILRLYKKLGGLDDNSTYPIKTLDTSINTIYRKEEDIIDSQSSNSSLSQSSSSNECFIPRVKIEMPDAEITFKECNISLKSEPDVNEVTCPVCYKPVLGDLINAHLDSCLKKEFSDESDSKKTLPKLVYHLLTEKEIKLKLKEHGLSISGGRKTLIRRHKNFITLYNANCDSLKPKQVSELINEIELQEVEEKINSLPKQIQVNKKSDLSLIDQQHKSYVKKHQSQFSRLISDVQQRQIAQFQIKPEKEDSFIENYEDEDNMPNQKQVLNDKLLDSRENSSSETKICKDDTDSSSSEDLETGKVAISLHRKRKKATLNTRNQESPKKK